MALVTVVNTRPTPWIIDEEGHLFEGGARGDVDDSQPRVQHALTEGVFVKVPGAQPATPQSPAVPAADQPKES